MIGQNGKSNLDKILLIDSSFEVDYLKDKESQYSKIITFDFDSHKILSDLKISHEISDSYLTKYELDQIQKETYRLSKWNRQKEISGLLDYDGINLGSLFFNDFIDFITSFLKKFCEITKVIKKYQNSEFVTSNDLFEIASTLSQNVKLSHKKTTTQVDVIKYSYQLGQKSIPITISRTKYIKLKNISELFLQKVFRFDKPTNGKKHVLLIEFDPTKYKTLLLSSKAYKTNFLLYNRRWPSIWNLESLCVVRKSGCRIATYKTLVNSDLEIKINQIKITIKEKLNDLLHNAFFNSFFSFNGISFWEALKPFFEEKLIQKMAESILEIEAGKKLFEKYKISSILILSEIGPNEQIMMHLARKNKIPIILMQHGVPYETKEAIERNNLIGFFPNFSDYMITWGNVTKEYVENFGIDSSKIQPLGNPVYDDLFNKKTLVHGDEILLATSPPMKDIVYDNLVETNKKYRDAIENICKITTKLNQKLIIKLHPSLVDFEIEAMANKINSKIKVIKSGSIFPLIERCNLIVTFDLSTTILEAQILKKPAISIKLKNYGFGISEVFKTNSCINISIDEFEKTLEKILTNSNYRNEVITNGDVFVNKYLVNKGTSVGAILAFLKKF